MYNVAERIIRAYILDMVLLLKAFFYDEIMEDPGGMSSHPLNSIFFEDFKLREGKEKKRNGAEDDFSGWFYAIWRIFKENLKLQMQKSDLVF